MAAFTASGVKDLPLVLDPYETPLVATVVRNPHPWFTGTVPSFAIDPQPTTNRLIGILWPPR